LPTGAHTLSQLSDEQLMAAAGKGDRKAFETLYHRYFDRLVRFSYSFMNDTQRSEDVVQEVFVRIIEKPELFDVTRKFSTWVYIVTGNECKQQLMKEQNRLRLLKQEVLPKKATSSEMHHDTDHKSLKEKLNVIYSKLTEKQKQIYSLRFEQEMSIREICTITGAPEGSVKSGIYYLLKKISDQLKEYTHER
jgi:RNA polymerase sigma-70 factor (ECF subfamily)